MENKKIAVFPGSFDPFTHGHKSIIDRALPLFEEIIIAIGINAEKKSFFDLETRIKWIKKIFADEPKVIIETFNTLTVDYCRKKNANFILRGLRTAADFEYERQIGQMNKHLLEKIETIFLLTLPQHTFISSSVVREIVKYQSDVSKFVPEIIAAEIHKSYTIEVK